MSLYINEDKENLKKSILSMLNQTIQPSEIVIVKDGSLTKELDKTLNDFKYAYPNIIKIYGYEHNKGLGYALRFGLTKCKNELIARMDTDDISNLDRCEKQLKFFHNNPEYDLVGGQVAEFIDDLNKPIAKRLVPLNHDELICFAKKRCPFNHMSVMFKKKAVIDAGNYQEFHYNEDYYLWIRLLMNNAKVANINDILVNVRVDKNLYMRRGGYKYFKSEEKLQRYMLQNRYIDLHQYILNIMIRFIVEIVFTNNIRQVFFRTLLRKS